MQSQDGKTVKSVVWSAVERLSSQGIQFVMGIIIARLLLPSDYGVVAMLTIFLALAQTFVDSGFGTALVQKKIERRRIIQPFLYLTSSLLYWFICCFFLRLP